MADLVVAGAWIAFAALLVLIVLFSIFFTRYFQDKHDREWLPTLVTIVGLILVLATVCLVPVDIFLFASTTDPATGEREQWATDEAVGTQTQAVTIVYYVMYSVMMFYSFVVIPFAYFYFEEYDENATTKQRALSALKYTSFTVVILIILLMLGLFLQPGEPELTDPEWYKSLLSSSNIVRAVIFMVAVLALLGWLIFIGYTAYGLVAWPIDMIRGKKRAEVEEIEVSDELASTRERQRALKAKYLSGKKVSKNDQKDLEDLERKERLLSRRSHMIETTTNSWWTAIIAFLRPFEFVFGILFLLLTLFIFVSILLTSIDKAANTICGAGCGFIIDNPTIFNPFNSMLLYSSKYFPLDYILLVLIIAYFFFATLAGMIKIGIRFIWINLYSVRARGTVPQGLLLMCLMLMLSLMCLNIVVTTLAPQYTSYGFQVYCNITATPEMPEPCRTNQDQLLFCDISAPRSDCTPSVISTIVNQISVTTPFFGVAFYVGNWLFLAALILSVVVALCRKRSDAVRLVDSDDEE